MRELNRKFVYDLSDLTSEELKELLNWLKENDENWEETELEDFTNGLGDITVKFYNNEWNWSKENATHNAKELFYTLENIQVDCRELSEDQIKEMADVFEKAGFDMGTLNKTDHHFHLNDDNNNYCVVWKYLDNKTTITYEKFMELFGNKEENFKKLGEVLNEELTEKAYEVSYIAEKPKQYQIGIDTFERCEANMTKEEILACVRFNIDKYIWRNKGQDLEDLEKIISYANWAIKQLKQQ